MRHGPSAYIGLFGSIGLSSSIVPNGVIEPSGSIGPNNAIGHIGSIRPSCIAPFVPWRFRRFQWVL